MLNMYTASLTTDYVSFLIPVSNVANALVIIILRRYNHNVHGLKVIIYYLRLKIGDFQLYLRKNTI